MPATRKPNHYRLRIGTPDGEFEARYSAHGLAELHFPDASAKPAAALPAAVPASIQRWHRLTCKAVKEILAGHTPVELPPLDVAPGTEFQQRVWRTLLQIKRGQTLSYGEIAKALGKPKAGRAVGGACGANPIPLLIPCHRVLAANRKIGGFSGGLRWKQKLLAREGVELAQ